ncbi:AbgT family transporter [Candidatus Sororendozoicomonas aggregata]|uniref:AbgT family transporter n=1 Tax=Candidatus Sororendozoicomonas aggregata TaxID=3073239 RepID=UPI002ED00A22
MAESTLTHEDKKSGFIRIMERVGHRIPDPVIIFMFLFVLTAIVSLFMGGYTFQSVGSDGSVVEYSINNMLSAEKIRWIFDNAILNNWLAYGNGVLGIILLSVLGVGIAEQSGLLDALIKKIAVRINERWLPTLLVFLGIMSSIATDAGYLILVPLAGMLYAGIGKNPLIGMVAAFAGVSAGFSANLIPATPIDVVVGVNAELFAKAQNVPFVNAMGEQLNPITMNYFFIVTSVFVLGAVGAFVTSRFVAPRLERQSWQMPKELDTKNFTVNPKEERALKFAVLGLMVSLAFVTWLAWGPLASYTSEAGKTVTPFLNNVVLMIVIIFAITGVFYGVSVGRFKSLTDVVMAMSKQMNTTGYILVLTFFSYQFLALLGESGIGTYVTYLGATFLQFLGLQSSPLLLLIAFILTTAMINLFVGGLTSKWMLLGPIFIPMLYQVNPAMTPDLITAAFRVADSSTNIITPMMSYAGVVLAFMRKYKPEMSLGDQIGIMIPYSISFIVTWTALLVGFVVLNIPLGF